MKIKRIGFVLLLALVTACMLMMTACGKPKTEHTHSYAEEVTAPTCTEKGYTTYTCSCGDNYVDAYVDAKGHSMKDVEGKAATCKDEGYTAYKVCTVCAHTEGKTVLSKTDDHTFEEEILVYPDYGVEGLRKLTCSICGYETEEAIDAVEFVVSDVSEYVLALLNGAKYTLDATDAEIVRFTKYLDLVSAEEWNSEHQSFALKLADLVLDGTGEALLGHIKLEIGTCIFEDGEAVPETFDEVTALYVYIAGDVISVEMKTVDGAEDAFELSLSEKFYEIFGELAGGEEAPASAFDILEQLQKYIPVLEGISVSLPAISEEFIADFSALCESIGMNLILSEEIDDGVKYTVNLAELARFLSVVDGKTVSEIIDDLYGEGTADAIYAFISALPAKTVGEIVDAAIALSENYGIPMEDTYALINAIVAMNGGAEDFDIEALVEEYYDVTIAELLATPDSEMTAEEITEMFASVGATLLESTVDALYIMMSGAPEDFSVIENLQAMLAFVGDAIVAEIVVDAEGNMVSMELGFSPDEENGVNLRVDEEGFVLVSKAEGEIVLEYSLCSTEEDGKKRFEANLVMDGMDYLDLIAIHDIETNVTEGEFVLRAPRGEMVYEERWDEELEEWVEDSYYQDYGFGVLASGSFTYVVGEEVENLNVILNLIDAKTDSVDRTFYIEFAKNAERAAISISNGVKTVELYHAYSASGEGTIGLRLIEEDASDFAHMYVSYADGALIAEGILKGEQFFYLLLSAEEYNIIVREEYYDEETEESFLDLVFAVSGNITDIENGKMISVDLKLEEDTTLVEAELSFTHDEENGSVLAFELLSDGMTAEGALGANIRVLENGMIVNLFVNGYMDGEEIAWYDYLLTVEDGSISWLIESRRNGETETAIDLVFETEVTDDGEIYVITYDIGKMSVQQYYTEDYDPVNDTYDIYQCTDYIYGSGKITLTVER